MSLETVDRIEPARREDLPETLADRVADLVSAAGTLGQKLHPRTASNPAHVVRLMNTYYSSLIEGHATRPLDIERALKGDFEHGGQRRALQVEDAAHVRVQGDIDNAHATGALDAPA